MRRLLMLIIAMLLLVNLALADLTEDIGIPAECLPVALMEQGSDDPAVPQVGDMALKALMAHHTDDGLVAALPYEIRVNRVMLSDGREAWVGAVFTQQKEMPVEAVLTVDAVTGAVLRYEENDTGWFCDTQQRWESVLGRYGEWPLAAQALFDQLYCVEVTHAVPPEGSISQEQACELALEAAGLAASRDTLRFERTLVHDSYNEQYVWMVTVCLDETELAQVILDAMDGSVMAVFDLREDVG